MDLKPDIPQTVAVRIAGRLGMTFFLNHLRTFGEDRDLLDGLILLSVMHANIDPLYRAGASPFETGWTPASDDLRPISISAIAASLSLPFETVRRRVSQLRDAGRLEATRHGLLAATGHFSSDRHVFERSTTARRVRNLCLDLTELGVVRDVTGPATGAPPSGTIVNHLATEYCLRQMETLQRHIGDVTAGILLIQIIRITTDHLDDTFTEYTEREDLVDDSLRRPTTTAHLAARAGVPAETARRHAMALVQRNWVAQTPQGRLYLTRDMLRTSPWPEGRRDNVVNLNRLIGGLAAQGALAAWGIGGVERNSAPA